MTSYAASDGHAIIRTIDNHVLGYARDAASARDIVRELNRICPPYVDGKIIETADAPVPCGFVVVATPGIDTRKEPVQRTDLFASPRWFPYPPA